MRAMRGLHRDEKPILPGEFRRRAPLLLVPAIGFAQPILEWSQLEPQLGAHAIDARGDRRNVEIRAEVQRGREELTASLLNLIARDVYEMRLPARDPRQQLDKVILRDSWIAREIVRAANRNVLRRSEDRRG